MSNKTQITIHAEKAVSIDTIESGQDGHAQLVNRQIEPGDTLTLGGDGAPADNALVSRNGEAINVMNAGSETLGGFYPVGKKGHKVQYLAVGETVEALDASVTLTKTKTQK